MSYSTTRRLIVAAGLGVLLLLAAVMYVRRVDTVEVAAVLLFIVVFLGFVFARLPGGLVAAVVATGAYAILRWPAAEVIGTDRVVTLVASRAVAYLAFGAVGGWATAQLARSLEKLDVYDQVDDETGLFNARFFVQDTELEMARSARYQTLFSVCMVDVDGATFEGLSRRQRSRLLRDLGEQLRTAVRTVDRAVHAHDDGVHHFAVICPETGAEGARVFVDRLASQLHGFLAARGAENDGDLDRTACTFPGDDAQFESLREQFAAIDRAEHPEP